MDHAAIIRAGVSKRASAIQGELDHWIAEHIHPADTAALGVALMRLAANEYSGMFDKAEIEEMFAYILDEKPALDA